MRKIIIALVTIFAALWGLYTLPLPEVGLQVRPPGPVSGEWTQTLASDFRGGELAGLQVTEAEDGEISLAPGAKRGIYTSVAQETPFTFNALGSHWVANLPSGAGLELEVRSSADGSSWTEWQKVKIDDDLPGEADESYGRLIMLPPGRYLQYRLSLFTEDLASSPTLKEITLLYINSQEGPTLEEAKAVVLPREAGLGVPQPSIISRAGWGAREDLTNSEPEYQTPEKFIIHHTVTSNFSPDPAAAVRAVFYYHAVTLGGGDIGYNFLIDWEGNIYEGRKGGDGVVGGHARRYNYGSIGIALIGDFSVTDITPEMEKALVDLIAWEADRFNIDPRQVSYFIDQEVPNIAGHRDVLSTSCPGERAYQRLPRVRELVWQSLLAHDPRLALAVSPEAEMLAGEVPVRADSTSPTVASLEIYLDGELVAQGPSPLEWGWDTREYPDGEHELRATALGVGGKSSELTRKFSLDNTPPLGAVTINQGAGFTAQRAVTLTLEAQDEGSGVKEMRLQEGGTSIPWEEFLALKEWALSEEEGLKTVEVRFRDGLGNRSPVYTDTIVLDMTPPGGWSEFQCWSLSRAMVRVDDEMSGLDPESAEYSLSSDGENWGEWEPAAVGGEKGAYLITARGSFGEGWLRFRVKDMAGNEGISPAYPLSETPAPTPTPAPSLTPTPAPSPTPTPEPSPTPEPEGLPDLVVESLVLPEGLKAGEPVTITLAIKNAGDGPVEGGFWTELYVDPREVPSMNSIGTQLGQGLFWYIPALEAGQIITMTNQEAEGEYSNFPGTLTAGRHELYAYVDGYNPGVEQGLVLESDEGNNLLGPLAVEVEGNNPQEEALRSFLRGLMNLLGRFFLRLGERMAQS